MTQMIFIPILLLECSREGLQQLSFILLLYSIAPVGGVSRLYLFSRLFDSQTIQQELVLGYLVFDTLNLYKLIFTTNYSDVLRKLEHLFKQK